VVVQLFTRVSDPADADEREAEAAATTAGQRGHARVHLHRRPAGGPRARLARKCASCTSGATGSCCSGVNEKSVQRRADSSGLSRDVSWPQSRGPPDGGDLDKHTPAALSAVEHGGRPLPNDTRARAETLFGADFSGVRVHDHPAARQAATLMRAEAYTVGPDIAFAAGKFDPATAQGRHLLHHELSHVVQQGAAPGSYGAEATAPPAAGEPSVLQRSWVGDALDFGADIVDTGVSAVVTGAEAVGGAVVEGAEFVGGLAKDAAIALVRRLVSEDLAKLMEQGPTAFIEGLVHEAIAAWLPSLFGGVDIIGAAGNLISTFNDAFGLIAGVLKGDAKACEAFGEMLGAIRDAATSLMDNPAVQMLKAVISSVGKTIGTIVEFVAAPIFDALATVIGGAWSGIKKAASTVWGWLKKVKDVAASAWDAVSEALGFSGEGEDSVWGWIKSKANAIWTRIKETFAPIIKPLKTLAMVVGAFTGLGQIYLIVKYGPKLVDALTWLWQHRDDKDIVKTARKELHDSLAQVLDMAQGFRDTVKGAVGWVVETATSLSTSLLELAGAISGVPLLEFAGGLVETLSKAANSLLEWGKGLFQQAAEWVTTAVHRIWAFIQPYKEVLSSLALAIINPPMIPIILAGWAWIKLPRCVKVPIIDFLLDIVIGALTAMPDLPIFGPLWALLKPGVLSFLDTMRHRSDDEKEMVSDRVAKIMAGASLDFIFGFVKGFLLGVWEGVSDPIKAIWMIMQGLTWVVDYLDSASDRALGIPPASDARPAAGASSAAPAPAAAVKMPASAPTPAASVAAAPRPSDMELADFVRQGARDLQPDVGVVSSQFFDALSEYFSGGEGTSFDSLASKFGELWAAIKSKIEEAGGDLAIKVTKFFTSDAEADAKIGEGVGWLAGTIIFQLALDAITAGIWEGVGPVLKGIAKFINWPMEVMGEAFKLIGKLGGYLIDGVKSLGKMASQAAGGALKAVVEALGSAGKKMIAMAEALIARFGGKGIGLAEKEAAKLTEREAAALAKSKAAAFAEREAAELGAFERKGAGALETEGAEAAEKRAARETDNRVAKEAEDQAAKGEGDAAREAAERPLAVAEAETIELGMQASGASLAALITALEASIMPRFSWVKGFKTEPVGLVNMVYMIGSKIPLLPFGSHAETRTPSIQDSAPTGPSFEGIIDLAEFENNPAIVDRLSRARPFDIGEYESLTGRGRYGRVGDMLDSDEALQNAYIRMQRGGERVSEFTRANPAIALPPQLHHTIRNLRVPAMQGLTPEQMLQFHLNQLAPFTPEYTLRTLESEARRFIAETF
jgi:phage-related protein